MTSRDDRNLSFLVKIWQERREIAGAVPQWRGSVSDIGRGTPAHYFDSSTELVRYLEQRSGIAPATDHSWRLFRLLRREDSSGKG